MHDKVVGILFPPQLISTALTPSSAKPTQTAGGNLWRLLMDEFVWRQNESNSANSAPRFHLRASVLCRVAYPVSFPFFL
jgi:hypothetical protein